ncbi:glycoside hydrolase family 5 protein [Auricularia subglabra TFB-10046 SS5]|nr:glycoside hydrolase family 5 protein [Auricularia subglabra TFB-10046 SS5]
MLVLFLLVVQVVAGSQTAAQRLPFGKPIRGVNLGNWLLMEPWMSPQAWLAMGGQDCGDCSTCIRSEFDLAKSLGRDTDRVFRQHWDTWFNQSDINRIVAAGLNTVRIPLGYWLVEPLVDRATEFYPRGGIKALKRELRNLQRAGVHAILDHHALPGVSSVKQMFAGRCTADVQFYTDANYERALVWAAVMTAVAHLDADFGSVFAIQAINEPIMDASQTPGLGQYEVDFVQVVRAVERALGIYGRGHGFDLDGAQAFNLNATLTSVSKDPSNGSPRVARALLKAIPALFDVARELGLPLFGVRRVNRQPLVANFMDNLWQRGGANPADAADGPAGYDDHLYYSFGGVADPNPTAYLTNLCNLGRAQADAAAGNSPMWFGEWSLATQFDATDDFLRDWADAQKTVYSGGGSAGWIFWSFKIEDGTAEQRQWDYFEGLRRGYFTRDPDAFHDADVCAPYRSSLAV